jgi:hypothetical protein
MAFSTQCIEQSNQFGELTVWNRNCDGFVNRLDTAIGNLRRATCSELNGMDVAREGLFPLNGVIWSGRAVPLENLKIPVQMLPQISLLTAYHPTPSVRACVKLQRTNVLVWLNRTQQFCNLFSIFAAVCPPLSLSLSDKFYLCVCRIFRGFHAASLFRSHGAVYRLTHDKPLATGSNRKSCPLVAILSKPYRRAAP